MLGWGPIAADTIRVEGEHAVITIPFPLGKKSWGQRDSKQAESGEGCTSGAGSPKGPLADDKPPSPVMIDTSTSYS